MHEKPSPYTLKHSQFGYSPITQKSIQSSHYIQEISSFEPHLSCTVHTNDCISHICLNCQFQCLCGTCLKEGNHKTHNIKNIEKSVKIVDRILNEYAIRLRSKSDILTLLSQSLNAQKTETYHQFCEHKKIVEEKFSSLMSALTLRQEQVLNQINLQQEQYFQRIETFSKRISEQTKFSINLIEIISQNIQKLQPTALCLFFANRRNIIEDALNQQKISKLKGSMPDVRLFFDSRDYDTVLEKVKVLHTAPEMKIHRSTSPKKILKKSIKNLGKTIIRNQKPRDSYQHNGMETPKQNKYTESHKEFIKFFRSPHKHMKKAVSSAKLMSMPASPERQKLSKNSSPFRGEQFKKKGRKTKK